MGRGGGEGGGYYLGSVALPSGRASGFASACMLGTLSPCSAVYTVPFPFVVFSPAFSIASKARERQTDRQTETDRDREREGEEGE